MSSQDRNENHFINNDGEEHSSHELDARNGVENLIELEQDNSALGDRESANSSATTVVQESSNLVDSASHQSFIGSGQQNDTYGSSSVAQQQYQNYVGGGQQNDTFGSSSLLPSENMRQGGIVRSGVQVMSSPHQQVFGQQDHRQGFVQHGQIESFGTSFEIPPNTPYQNSAAVNYNSSHQYPYGNGNGVPGYNIDQPFLQYEAQITEVLPLQTPYGYQQQYPAGGSAQPYRSSEDAHILHLQENQRSDNLIAGMKKDLTHHPPNDSMKALKGVVIRG